MHTNVTRNCDTRPGRTNTFSPQTSRRPKSFSDVIWSKILQYDTHTKTFGAWLIGQERFEVLCIEAVTRWSRKQSRARPRTSESWRLIWFFRGARSGRYWFRVRAILWGKQVFEYTEIKLKSKKMLAKGAILANLIEISAACTPDKHTKD